MTTHEAESDAGRPTPGPSVSRPTVLARLPDVGDAMGVLGPFRNGAGIIRHRTKAGMLFGGAVLLLIVALSPLLFSRFDARGEPSDPARHSASVTPTADSAPPCAPTQAPMRRSAEGKDRPISQHVKVWGSDDTPTAVTSGSAPKPDDPLPSCPVALLCLAAKASALEQGGANLLSEGSRESHGGLFPVRPLASLPAPARSALSTGARPRSDLYEMDGARGWLHQRSEQIAEPIQQVSWYLEEAFRGGGDSPPYDDTSDPSMESEAPQAARPRFTVGGVAHRN